MKIFFISVLFSSMFLYSWAQDPTYPVAPTAVQNIVAAEYFIDNNDPGLGNAIPIAISAGTNISNTPVTVNVTGLSNGMHRVCIRTRSVLGIWSVTNIREFLYDSDPIYSSTNALQNIVAAEYFIDTDPGFGNATPINITAGANLTNIALNVDVTGLSDGIHRIIVRSRSALGIWSISNVRDFLYDGNPAYNSNPTPQNLIATEYFIDNDPGFGNATPISITPSADLNNIAAAVNTTGLSNGLHRLLLRSKSAEGYWSSTAIKDFIVNQDPAYADEPTNPPNILAAEYFINTDPGVGNGTPISITAGIDINDVAATINTSSLTPATTNRLYVRTKSEAGIWSITGMKIFEVLITNDPPYTNTLPNSLNIIASEYFINNDPGLGNGTPINITAGVDINNIAANINTASLTPATTNRLFIRTKNAEGFWSIANIKVFEVLISNDPPYSNTLPNAQNIVAAEYFVNSDPGLGNGTPISITAAVDINNIAASINTASLTAATTNRLFLRTKNAEGFWSITGMKVFEVLISNDPPYSSIPAIPQNITAAEYFIDTDPGFGNGTSLSVVASVDLNNLSRSINTNGLADGVHSFFLRTKSAEGNWSTTNYKKFFVNELALSADSLLFGITPLNVSVQRNLILTNNSAVNQTISLANTSAPFSTDVTGTITIAPSQKDTIVVSFTPTTIGNFNTPLTLQTSAGNFNVSLRGTGINTISSFTVSPATGRNYGNVAIGNNSNFNFTISNTGNIPVTLNSAFTNDPAFVVTFTAGTLIPVNGSVSLPVSFTPSAVNNYNATLTVSSTDAGTVTANLSGAGFTPGTPPILQYVSATPYSSNTGVFPGAGQPGNFTYKILYRSPNNRAPQTGSPRVSIDLNGDQDFSDINEGSFVMQKETAGTDYVSGIVYSYTYTHQNNTNNAGYRFSATDDNGNVATSINTNFINGPIITDQLLDLRIFANDISFSASNPLPGQTFTVFAKVSNNTALPASNVPVKFYRDTILIGSDVIPNVNAFSSAIISRNLNFAAEGFYPIKVWIDSSNTLADINPLNNYAIRPVIVGTPNLPGGINVTTNAVKQECPQLRVIITGRALYFGTGSPTAVAGAEVIINTGTQQITTYTNGNGDYSYSLTGVTCGNNFVYNVSVTDFTFTSSLVTNSIALPCPSPTACIAPPSMGGVFVSTSSSPCSNIVGSNGTVNLRLKYRERNLANFWNGFDEIINDTLRIFENGVLVQTIGSADYSNSPGNEVIVPINVPLTSTAPVAITATLSYTYIEYLQIPSSTYYGNYMAMSQTGSVTINPISNQPDLTLQSFSQTSATSFTFNNANLKCVAAGAHQVRIFDSIPGGTLTLIDTRNISAVGASGFVPISYSNPSLTSGTHFIRVITDFNGDIAESNETNNTSLFTLIVPASELTVTKISNSPTALSIGNSTQFSATIRNTGRPTGSFNVRFTANGTQIGTLKNVVSLAQNATINVSADLYNVPNNFEDCGVVIEVFVDANNQVVESDENNNTRQITLGTDLAPYELPNEVGSVSNPVVVRINTTNQFFPAIRNLGYRDAGLTTVRFSLNGNFIGSDTIGNIKAGEIFAGRAAFSYTFTTAGNYVVKVLADTSNLICENSETNNEGNFYIRVVEAKADLEVLSQFISPSSLNPNIGQTITIVGTVKNRGGQVSAPTSLRFVVDGIQLGTDVQLLSILPGRDTTVAASTPYSSLIPGVKVMRLIADPLNVIVEEREDNNEATRTMIVGDAPDFGRLKIGAISFNPSGFEVDDSVDVKFDIKNFGPQPGSAWVKFLITDTLFNVLEVDSVQFSLNDGDSISIQRRMLFTTTEGYVTTQIFSSNPIEFDLLNNFDTLRFTTVARLQNAISINGDLDMKAAAPEELPGWIGGKIVLGDFDLTINGTILNFDTSRFIVTNGTGKLKLINNSAINTYPVGPTINSFNFVELNNSGTADNFSVRVRDYVLRNGNTGDSLLIANVDRTWFIEETIAGGSNVTATFFWSTTHELPGFDRTACRTAHYRNVWELGSVGNAILLTNGEYSKTQSNFTSFSPFTVTSGNGIALPVRLVSFNAINRTKDVLLQWLTTNEINALKFEVERSKDANSFTSIGSLPANNTTGNHTYQMLDQFPLNGIAFYRLKMIDIDGSYVYSDVVSVNRADVKNGFTLYPNPAITYTNLYFNNTATPKTIQLFDANGKLIQRIQIPAGQQIFKLNTTHLASGWYSIQLIEDGKLHSINLIK